MPEIDPSVNHLVELFYLSGMATSTGMGLVPLSWQELRAFRLENKLDLLLWEREALQRMSASYCREYALSSDPQRPAPYVPQNQQDEEEANIKAAMRMLQMTQRFRKKQ